MFKNLIQLYAIAICFCATAICMIMLLFIVNDVTSLIFPEYMNKVTISSFDTNEKYLRDKKNGLDKEYYEQLVKTPKEELDKIRVSEKEDYIINIKTKAGQEVITQAYRIVIVIAFFIIHWRLYKRNSRIDNV